MKVHVRYFAAAADYAGTDAEVLEVPEGASVADLAATIKRARAGAERAGRAGAERVKSERLAKVLDLASFLVNGRRCEPSEVLPADAEVDVLPPFAGGSAADAAGWLELSRPQVEQASGRSRLGQAEHLGRA